MIYNLFRISYFVFRVLHRHLIILLVVLIIFVYSPILHAQPSVDVPVRHWSYDAVEKLSIIGLADILDIGTRPISRIRMAYVIKTAIDKASNYEYDFNDNEQEYLEELLSNLIDEFREELVLIDVGVASVSDEGPKKCLIGSPQITTEKIYANIDPRKVRLRNKEGWGVEDGFNLRAKISSWAKFFNIASISVTPGLRSAETSADFDIEDAHARFSCRPINTELAIGRSSMWWGPGFSGSLLMTDNAFPLDAIRLNNIRPMHLPFLKKIGSFNGIFFVSRLEEKRVIPNPFVSGWRIDYAPLSFLKLGFGHILMFGGKGVKRIGFSNFWAANSLIFSAAGGGDETANHIIAGDIQIFLKRIDRIIPLATGAKFYSEWGAEDESGNTPIDIASIVGAYFTDVFTIPGFDGKIEFAKLHEIWYTHFKYASGYTHREYYLGHHLGGDSEEIAATAIFNFPKQYNLSLSFNRAKRGLTKLNIETTNALELQVSALDAMKTYNIEGVEIDIFYRLEDITNFENNISKVKNHIIGVKMSRKF